MAMISLEDEREYEDSDSQTSGSSYYTDESEDNIPWLSHVKSDGSLFYMLYDNNLDYISEHSVELPVEKSSHSFKSITKRSTTNTIKKWMKERGKKVKKFIPLFKPSRSDAMSVYVSKDVFIDVEPLKSEDTITNLSELLLGLRLGSENENGQPYDKVCILGILPGTYVPDVDIGDWVKSINDIDVNCGNFENVLNELKLPSKVKLSIMTLPNSNKMQFMLLRHDNLIKELDGDPAVLENAKSIFQNVPHGLFFLSLNKETIENEDVLYRYPDENTPLFQLKGMFLTLSLMIDDVATSPLLSCSVMIQEQLIHVAFIKEGEHVMVLAIPDEVKSYLIMSDSDDDDFEYANLSDSSAHASCATLEEVQYFSSSLAKLFRYLFSSLEQAFSTGNKDKYLDNFLILFFKHYMSSLQWDYKNVFESHLLDILPSAKWLPLHIDIQTEIDNVLSEVLSADFGNDSEGFNQNTRIYNIHGACFFFKGYLVSSTFVKDDMLDIHMFLHYNHILELTEIQPISEVIIWREVFPSRLGACSNDPEFEEVESRWFLNVVVMDHCVFAVLLTDGGCALKAKDHPSPEPFYIREITNALFVMEAGGILSAIEEKIEFNSGLLPEEMNSLSSAFTSNISLSSSGPNLSSVCSASHSSLGVREGSSNKGDKRQQFLSCPADGESDSSSKDFDISAMKILPIKCRSTSTSTIESGESSEQIKDMKDQTAQNFSSSLPNLMVPQFSPDNTLFQTSLKMSSVIGKNIFHYLHMDPVEGVYIAPLAANLSASEVVDNDVVINFHKICLRMRIIFEQSLICHQITKANIKTKCGVEKFPQFAEEQGFSFICNKPDSTKKKKSHNLQFWVVGRLFFVPEPREVYVCYLSDVPKDVIEMAFRLGFGISF